MNVRDYHTLWTYARRRQRSEVDYRAFQSFQSRLLIKYLQRFGVELDGRRVLDLGSGIGGYSIQMARLGARVLSLDLAAPTYRLSPSQEAAVANALAIPVHSDSFNLVFCASLIEHVADPERLLNEIVRVLSDGGIAYVSFPPFFCPQGGHEYAPFHYLGERWALRLSRDRKRLPEWVSDIYRVSAAPRAFSEGYEDWGLYKMTIAGAKRLIARTDLRVIDMSTRYLPVSMIRWPVLGEVFTWHAQFLLEKPVKT